MELRFRLCLQGQPSAKWQCKCLLLFVHSVSSHMCKQCLFYCWMFAHICPIVRKCAPFNFSIHVEWCQFLANSLFPCCSVFFREQEVMKNGHNSWQRTRVHLCNCDLGSFENLPRTFGKESSGCTFLFVLFLLCYTFFSSPLPSSPLPFYPLLWCPSFKFTQEIMSLFSVSAKKAS